VPGCQKIQLTAYPGLAWDDSRLYPNGNSDRRSVKGNLWTGHAYNLKILSGSGEDLSVWGKNIAKNLNCNCFGVQIISHACTGQGEILYGFGAFALPNFYLDWSNVSPLRGKTWHYVKLNRRKRNI